MASVNNQESMHNKKSMYNATYVCNNKTHAACSNNVAKQLGMRIIKTIDDGDCFFDTLATYGWAYHYDALERPHQELRQALVDYMEKNMGDVAPYVIVNENEGETIESMIESLREDMVWNNDMGDLLSQIAAKAFQVNIYIYNVDPPEVRRLRANQKVYPGRSIHMLRINDGHYQLLLPQEDAPHVIGSYASAHKKSKKSKAAVSKTAKSKTAKNSNNSKNGNNGNSVHKLSKAFSMASISNHTHKNHGNHGNHGNNSNHENHGIYEFNEQIDYKKITIKDLIAFLLSNNMTDGTYAKIEAIPTAQKKKEAYYAEYDKLFKKK
jgi:OTU-like cysteine protease